MCDTCVAMLISYVEERRRNKLSRWVALGQGGPLFITIQTAISLSPSLMMGRETPPAAFQTEWMGFNKFKIICTFASKNFSSNVCFQTLQWYENQTWSGWKCHLYHMGVRNRCLSLPSFFQQKMRPQKLWQSGIDEFKSFAGDLSCLQRSKGKSPPSIKHKKCFIIENLSKVQEISRGQFCDRQNKVRSLVKFTIFAQWCKFREENLFNVDTRQFRLWRSFSLQ